MKPDDHGPARLGTNSCGRWRMQTDDHRKRPFTTELGRWMIAGGGRQARGLQNRWRLGESKLAAPPLQISGADDVAKASRR